MGAAKGDGVRQFFDIEARALLDRFQVLAALLPHRTTAGSAHRGEEGRHIEALVREFLNRHLPGDLRAVSGFILRPATKTGEYDLSRVSSGEDQYSRQLDVIVYDFSRFPVYERFEEFAIIPPEGVVAIISIKKTLVRAQISAELRALAEAVDLCRSPGRRSPFTALVAFSIAEPMKRRGPQTCFEMIRAVHDEDPFDRMITEICVLPAFTVFKFRKEGSDRLGYARYVSIDTSDKPHVAVQRLINSILSVYHDPTRGRTEPRPGFVSFRKGTFEGAPLLGYVAIDGTAEQPWLEFR